MLLLPKFIFRCPVQVMSFNRLSYCAFSQAAKKKPVETKVVEAATSES